MKKGLISILLIVLTCCPSLARNRRNDFFSRVHYDIDWGYSQHFYTYHSYNFINSEGNRIPGGRQGMDWSPAGCFLLGAGYDITPKLGMELLAGYAGATSKDRYLPILLRLDYYYQGYAQKGTFSFIQGGAGLRMPFGNSGKMSVLGAIGQGYRIPLAAGINLDLKMSLQFTFDTPPIPDPDGPGNVPERNIRKNNARYYALNISLGINF